MLALQRNTLGRSRCWSLCALGLAVLLPAGAARADDIVRVEEDWVLLVNEPDSQRASPQLSTQMARAPWVPRYCNLHLNSSDIPSFAVGGMQLQVWNNNSNINLLTSSSRAVMSTSNELVTWTQYIRKDSSVLKFGISSASSTTWGDFGGVEVAITGGLTDLSEYDADYSQQNSGVTYGANRVASLVLVTVRKIRQSGLVTTDNTPRVVFSQQLDPDLNP